MTTRLKTALRATGRKAVAFRKDTNGSATIEAVLWLPLFVVFFVMVADVSFVFHRQSQVLRAVQDGNRALSTGRIADVTELETYLTDRLSSLTDSAVVTSQMDTGIVETQVLVPVDDLVAVGMFNFLTDFNIGVTSQQFIEF